MNETIKNIFEDWTTLVAHLKDLKRDLNITETNLLNTQNKIGAAIDNGFQKINEVFIIAIENTTGVKFVIESIKDDENDYRIQLRTEKSKKIEPKPTPTDCTEAH